MICGQPAGAKWTISGILICSLGWQLACAGWCCMNKTVEVLMFGISGIPSFYSISIFFVSPMMVITQIFMMVTS
jgi:hypothetical protein